MPIKIKSLQSLNLIRYPQTKDKSLRAWSAADELLLNELKFRLESDKNSNPNILIVNDQFGALSLALYAYSPTYWTDSFLSETAIEQNLKRNTDNASSEMDLNKLVLNYNKLANDELESLGKHQFDYIVIRIPKHNSLLSLQLAVIRQFISDKTQIIAGGMVKEIHNSNLKLFEKYLGETKTSMAIKKARLIFPKYQKEKLELNHPISSLIKSYSLPEKNITIYGLPGVFSRKSLDIGTKVLFDNFPSFKLQSKIVDLGCGSGVIGASIAKTNPGSQVYLVDESALAVESARYTFEQNGLDNGIFLQADALKGMKHAEFDHIVCNPPFHQQNVQTMTIAKNMIKQSAKCLKPDGILTLVANRHLKYYPILCSFFDKVYSESKDNKFTVWHASMPKY